MYKTPIPCNCRERERESYNLKDEKKLIIKSIIKIYKIQVDIQLKHIQNICFSGISTFVAFKSQKRRKGFSKKHHKTKCYNVK